MQSKTKSQTQGAEQAIQPLLADSLQIKLTPHFFFNVLNSIYHSIRLNPDQAEDILINFSELMQYQIYDCPGDKISLEKEIKSIRNFIYLQKMKFPPEFGVEVTVKGETENQRIPPTVFVTVIENIFKHGFNGASPNSFLKVEFSIQKNHVLLVTSHSLTDSGSSQSLEYEKSLEDLQSKLQVLFSAICELKIDRTARVCSISVQCPFS